MNDRDDFNPMNHPSYRRVVREISDRFHRLKGLPPLPPIEEERWNMLSIHDALAAWQRGHITEAKALQLTGAVDAIEMYAIALNSDVEIRDVLSDDQRKAVEAAHKAMNAATEE